jgi:hypothetical protein
MALPASGTITLSEVNVELGFNSGATITFGSSDVRGLFDVSSGTIAMSNGYGKSSATTLGTSSAGYQLVGNQSGFRQISASTYINSGGTLIIPTGYWLWSDTVGTPALTIDVACTVINNGFIVGRGGDGATEYYDEAKDGNQAIVVSTTGVTIVNASGAYIAGGGGGGDFGGGGNFLGEASGGGGAGGGATRDYRNGPTKPIGAIGLEGGDDNNAQGGAGGTAGAAQSIYYNSGSSTYYDGGSGGRQLPGIGGTATDVGGDGGNGNGVGGNGGQPTISGGGGGGWGAAGGQGFSIVGSTQGVGAGGKAIDNGVINTYTLTNNGTVYGAT